MASGLLKDYIGHGDAADRPVAPDLATGVLGFWWAEDTSELSLWDGATWQEDILASGGGAGIVETIVAGTNVTVDDTDPANPIVSASGSGGGVIVAVTQTQSAAQVNSGGATIALDNTIPQNTEGAEYTQIATAHTPADALNILDIEVFISMFVLSTNVHAIGGLFKDTDANALAAVITTPSVATYANSMLIKYSEVAGSTAARTYKFRYGGNGGTMYINQRADGNSLGGVMCSHMRITERTP